MKRKFLILVAILAVALMAAPAGASTVTYSFTGTDAGSDPISATATFTTGPGTITVDITNNIVNVNSVGADISDLSFVLSPGTYSGASIGALNGASERLIASDGTYTNTPVTSSHWAVLETGVNFLLNTLYGGSQADTIVGPPDASNLYSGNGNASFSAGHHAPELYGAPVEFVLNVTGVTADTTVTSAIFSFGTTPEYHCGTSPVPIPPTALLLGSGLLGLVGLGWRRKRG